MVSEISLPVSIGEALDKLTILDIKMSKINDGRRADCEKEYNALYSPLETYIKQFPWHYRILREINLEIWELQDRFHGKEISEIEAGKICTQILKENDRRFRMKAKLNHLVSSNLREQKGYGKKKAFFYGHLGLGDMFWLCGAVRYLSTCYDNIIVVCKTRNIENVRQMYLDDPSIHFLEIEDDIVLHPFQQVKRKYIEADGLDVYACGYHSENPRIYEFPHCFYDDLKFSRDIRTKYFYVPTTPGAKTLFDAIYSTTPTYGIVHQQSSQKRLPIWESIAKDRDDFLLLDVNENHYPEGHKYHAIAQRVVNQPLLDYKTLLENATEIHLLESSLYCFASHLDLHKVQKKLCYDAFDSSNERLGIFTTGRLG